MVSIAFLLTVHNRRENTIECLKALFSQNSLENYDFDIFLTDDGCNDGTPEQVARDFPSVKIIKGDGSLFWNRGMYKAWEEASKTKMFDYFIWLNDDTILHSYALSMMIESSKLKNDRAIICGPTCSKINEEITYSGWMKDSTIPITPNGFLQECEIVNGNFLLVPQEIFKSVGNLDWTFRHAIGDFDYGLRAQKAGFKCYLVPTFIGFCEKNPNLPKWCLPTTSLLSRFKILYSPLGYAEPIPFFIYEKRHFGLLIAIKHFCSINIRALFPQLWK